MKLIKSIIGVSLPIIIVGLLGTCTKDISGPDFCFNDEILPIFISNCTMSGCHNSVNKAGGYDLTTYEGIRNGVVPKHPLRSDIYKAIKGKNPSMPESPYPKLNSKDVNKIKLWINLGANNSSNCLACDTTDYTYSTRVDPIMQSWCIGCHNSNNNSGGFDLSTYNGVVSSIPNNKLLGSIKHLSGFYPMPQNGPKISQCEIDAIDKWVSSGYPNN